MILSLLAQMPQGWSIQGMIVALVIIIGAVGILYVVCKVAEIPIPEWLVKILLIVLVVVIAVVAIRFLFSLLSG